MFLLALWQIGSKSGRALAAIRESEPAALAAGVNVTLYKLWAFALASFMTGVAGGLLAGSAGSLSPNAFPTQDSIVLLAVVLMGGIYSVWGAVVAGLLVQAAAGAARELGRLALRLAASVRGRRPPGARDGAGWARRPGAEGPEEARAPDQRAARAEADGAGGVIEVDGLTRPLRRRDAARRHDRDVPGRGVRPDRPERRGQDDVLQRAQRLRQAGGRDDPRIRGGPARDGRLPSRALGPSALVPDGAGDRGAVRVRQRRDDPRALGHESHVERAPTCESAIEFVGLDVPSRTKVGVLGARERRLVEVARAVVGQPRVVLLDEPAAGLPRRRRSTWVT